MANFIKIETREALQAAMDDSFSAPVVLFKHSLTCPISHGVYAEVERFSGDVRLVVVQTSRDVSNQIEAVTGVRHESPQALVVRDGKVLYHASHYDISAADLTKYSV